MAYHLLAGCRTPHPLYARRCIQGVQNLSSSPEKQDKARFHITALGIHLTVTARDLVFLFLLGGLAEGLKDDVEEEPRWKHRRPFCIHLLR